MTTTSDSLETLQKLITQYTALKASLDEDKDEFMVEFLLLKQEVAQWREKGKGTTKHGAKEANRKKNRYKDILPYDKTRVILPKRKDGSDYINANYIKGPSGEVEYIASQGPMAGTVEDFWWMIWNHKPKVIAMLCKEIELGKHRCQRYWAEENEELKFGDIKVTLIREMNIGDNLTYRTIKYSKGTEELTLGQIHFTAWPDHGAPASSIPILHLIEKVRQEKGSSKNPVVIHCSAGCGRTGAIIAIDYARKLIEAKSPELNIYDIVRGLRKQRPAMVQSREQYEYVYSVINELATRELERTDVGGARPGVHTYVNIDRFKGQERSLYSDFEELDAALSEGELKRSQSLKTQLDTNGSDSPLTPTKPPKTEQHAVSPGVSRTSMPKGASLPNQPAQRKYYENQDYFPARRPSDYEVLDTTRSRTGGVPVPLSKDYIPENSSNRPQVPVRPSSSPKAASLSTSPIPPSSGVEVEAKTGRSPDYEVPNGSRSRAGAMPTGAAKGAKPDSPSDRPQVAARPPIAKRPSSGTLSPDARSASAGSLQSPTSPAEGTRQVYAAVAKPQRSQAPQDSTYEQIWAVERKPAPTVSGRGSESGRPPLPERTPESFLTEDDNTDGINDRESATRQGDVTPQTPVGGEQANWFTGKLKKIGNIMSPFNAPAQQGRSKTSTSSDSVFYGFDGTSDDGARKSLERNVTVSTYTTAELGFNKRLPMKPRGPRPPPSTWPHYPNQPMGNT